MAFGKLVSNVISDRDVLGDLREQFKARSQGG